MVSCGIPYSLKKRTYSRSDLSFDFIAYTPFKSASTGIVISFFRTHLTFTLSNTVFRSDGEIPSTHFANARFLLESFVNSDVNGSEKMSIISKISSWPGSPTSTVCTKRRQMASSSISAWLVAAISTLSAGIESMFWSRLLITLFSSPNSCWSFLAFAIASNSSRKRIHGTLLAYSNIFLMFFAVLPNNDDTIPSSRATTSGSPVCSEI